MKFYFITFRSVTFAQRAEALLTRNNMRCTLQRTPRWMEEQGCGYCLRVRLDEIGPSMQLLRQGRVQFRKVYIQQEDGSVEEMTV